MQKISEILGQSSSPPSTLNQKTYEEPVQEDQRESQRISLNLTSWDNTFENFRSLKGTQESLKAFKELASLKATWHMLLCYGAAGCGKTHLCEALSIKLFSQGIWARVNEWPSVIRYFKNVMRSSELPGEYDELFESYCKAPWLILDDAGGSVGSAWEWGEFDELVNYRYRQDLPTVVTTNLDITKLPDRAVSRFRDAIKGRCVLNSGDDYRPKRKP